MAPQRTTRRRRSGDGPDRWPTAQADAWLGLLETHKRVTRAVEEELNARHDLSLSALELLYRLDGAEDRTLRASQLADLAGLSLSRVSRIVDGLEARGLVERRPCETDTRAKLVTLTPKGAELLAAGQATHADAVRRLFLDHVRERDIATLARVFAPFRR